MSSLSHAVADLLIAVQAEPFEPDAVNRSIQEVFGSLPDSVSEERAESLQRLAEAIEDAPLRVAAGLSLASGAIVEHGGNPMTALPAILARLPEALASAATFVAACEEAAEEAGTPVVSPQDVAEEMDDDAPDEHPDPVGEFGSEVAERMPNEASIYRTLDPFCLGAIAMLSRSKQARKATKSDERLIMTTVEMAPYHPRAAFLLDLLLVLDDEPLLVIHPESRSGWKLRISGVADNFQLHTLLAGELIGDSADGKLPGEPPDPLVLAASTDQPMHPDTPHAIGVFNLVNWPGLLPDGTLGDGTSDSGFWIWGEGVPSDILPFEGLRVILLGPPPYMRGWNAGRRFPSMNAQVEIEQTLSPENVEEWIERFLHAPKPTHPEDLE